MQVAQTQQQVVISSQLRDADTEERRPEQFPFKQGEEFEAHMMLWDQRMMVKLCCFRTFSFAKC